MLQLFLQLPLIKIQKKQKKNHVRIYRNMVFLDYEKYNNCCQEVTDD